MKTIEVISKEELKEINLLKSKESVWGSKDTKYLDLLLKRNLMLSNNNYTHIDADLLLRYIKSGKLDDFLKDINYLQEELLVRYIKNGKTGKQQFNIRYYEDDIKYSNQALSVLLKVYGNRSYYLDEEGYSYNAIEKVIDGVKVSAGTKGGRILLNGKVNNSAVFSGLNIEYLDANSEINLVIDEELLDANKSYLVNNIELNDVINSKLTLSYSVRENYILPIKNLELNNENNRIYSLMSYINSKRNGIENYVSER
jgi:hypothetical protein